jgi:hypothetical protein
MLRWARQTWLLSTRIPLLEAALYHSHFGVKVTFHFQGEGCMWPFLQHSKSEEPSSLTTQYYWQPEPNLMASLAQSSQLLLNPQPAPTHPHGYVDFSTPLGRSWWYPPLGDTAAVRSRWDVVGSLLQYGSSSSTSPCGHYWFGGCYNPPGFSYSDFWDDTVLQLFGFPAADPALHCHSWRQWRVACLAK